MILEYDNNPNLTLDQKLQSLKEKVQLALDERARTSESLYRSLLSALGVNMSTLRNDFTSLSERLEAETQALTTAVTDALTRLSAVEEIAEQVEPIQSDISSIKSRLTTVENNYTALARRVSTLETNYTALERRVKALEDA